MIEIKVNGHVVSVQNTEPLYSGSADTYNCSFSFDASWDGFSRSAVFRVGSKVVTAVLDEEGVCLLPWELLTRANIGLEIEVGVYGVSAETEVLTSVWDSLGTVCDGSEIGNDAREPGAGVYDQVMASVQRIDEKVLDYSSSILAITQRAESAAKSAQKSSAEAKETVVEVNKNADRAEDAMTAAQDVFFGVRKALDDLPEGDTVIVNDLTTGGAGAALSAEMGKVLGRRPNPGLLDNAWFLRPVNQRGLTEYTGTGYTIDRWQMRSNGNASTFSCRTRVTERGVEIVNNSDGNTAFFTQLLENTMASGEYTLSALVAEATGTVRIAFYNASGSYVARKAVTGKGMVSLTANITTDNPVKSIRIAVSAGASVTISAIKLERGEAQTLAHQDASGNWVPNEITDYAAERRKCQRYFQVINGAGRSDVHLLDVWGAGSVATGTLPLPVPMRVTPTATINGLEPTVWLTKWDGDTKYVGKGKISSIAVSADTADEQDIVWLRLEVVASVASDAGFVFEADKKHDVTSAATGNIGTSSRIFLDANL